LGLKEEQEIKKSHMVLEEDTLRAITQTIHNISIIKKRQHKEK